MCSSHFFADFLLTSPPRVKDVGSLTCTNPAWLKRQMHTCDHEGSIWVRPSDVFDTFCFMCDSQGFWCVPAPSNTWVSVVRSVVCVLHVLPLTSTHFQVTLCGTRAPLNPLIVQSIPADAACREGSLKPSSKKVTSKTYFSSRCLTVK